MANHRPHAGDSYFVTTTDPAHPNILKNWQSDSILAVTRDKDMDGDSVHLAFVNGQRIAPSIDPQHSTETEIKGQYGTLTVDAAGTFTYAFDQGNAAVQGLAPGAGVDDHFTFKISDGRGGTDFGYFDVIGTKPEAGTFTADFEHAGRNYPFDYKGIAWGTIWDADEMSLHHDGKGNAFVQSGEYTTFISTADGNNATFDSVDVTTWSASYGADVTFTGWRDSSPVDSLTVAVGPGDGGIDMNKAEHVALSSLGPIDQLQVAYDVPNYQYDPLDIPALYFDNFTITV
jgi:autoaggregation protein RapA/B/C